MFHPIYRVRSFQITAPYILKVQFDDGSEQSINFEPVLVGQLYGPLRDLSIFNRVQLDAEVHTVVWPNGADFDPATLHDWPEQVHELAERAASGNSHPRRPPIAARTSRCSGALLESCPSLVVRAMKIRATVLGYLAALVATVHYLYWLWQLSVSGGIAFLFAFAFSLIIRGKEWVPLGVVALFTIVFPLGVLVAIGIPVYPNVGATLAAIAKATREHNPLLGLEACRTER